MLGLERTVQIDLVLRPTGRRRSYLNVLPDFQSWVVIKIHTKQTAFSRKMANYLMRRALLDAVRVPVCTRASSSYAELDKIGNREWVGYGFNGQPNYVDRPDFPLPAVRFRPDTPDIKVLREKEKSDWRKLTIEEKKALYRASFCQTFAEFQAPSGEWKGVLGWSLVGVSLAVWVYMAMKLFVYSPLPESLSDENQKAQLKRMLDLKVNPVDGLASKWDYENNRWK